MLGGSARGGGRPGAGAAGFRPYLNVVFRAVGQIRKDVFSGAVADGPDFFLVPFTVGFVGGGGFYVAQVIGADIRFIKGGRNFPGDG